MPNELVKVDTPIEKEASDSLFGVLKKYERTLVKILPKELSFERWQWLVINSIRKVPNLAGCTPFSFINAVMLAANLKIEIRDRSAYLVPFGKECTLMIDYRAKIDLASRAGVTIFPPQLVREADEFRYGWSGESLVFEHIPALLKRADGKLAQIEDRGEVVAGWCAAKNQNGHTVVQVMTLREIDRIRRRSRNGYGDKTFAELCNVDISQVPYKQRGPWLTDPERMAEKTLVHQLFNRVPQNEQMAVSQEIDRSLEDEHTKPPVATGLESLALELDPGDDKPMVDGGGDTKEEHVAARQAVLDKKLGKPNGKPVREVDELPDPLEVKDDRLYCKGQLYARNEDSSAWRRTDK